MKAIGATFGDLVGDAATGVTISSVRFESVDADFLHRILGRTVGKTLVPGAVGHAVDQEFVGLGRRAGDTKAGDCAVVERPDGPRFVGPDNAHGQPGKHHRSAAVHGQVVDLFGGNNLSDA